MATESAASSHQSLDSDTILERYGKLPMAFEKNHGQADDTVDFVALGAGYRVLLTHSEAVINLTGSPPKTAIGTFRMRFVGARRNAAGAGIDPLPGKTSYFKGSDSSRHLSGIESFARVRYPAIYSGIDLVYYGNQRHLEYDLVVSPGGDPAQIRIAFEGPERIEIDDDGNLVLHTGSRRLIFQRPFVYQLVEGEKRAVEGQYVRTAENQVSFSVAAYDTRIPLVIDPVLSYSTYIGGTSDDAGTAIAVDAAGNAYVAGYTYSSNFPLKNPYDRSLGNSDRDVFVTKIDPTGSALAYSTYLGGRNTLDWATGIAVDETGNAYITGRTTGSDFPVTSGAYQSGATGGGAFVTKLNASGTGLVYSTYVLGATGTRIAVDAAPPAPLTSPAAPNRISLRLRTPFSRPAPTRAAPTPLSPSSIRTAPGWFTRLFSAATAPMRARALPLTVAAMLTLRARRPRITFLPRMLCRQRVRADRTVS